MKDLIERLQVEVEWKELLKQLIIQNKNQQDLQHEIPSSITSDHKTVVNRFTPVTTEIDASHNASSCEPSINFELQTTSQTNAPDDVNITSNASSRQFAYMARSEKRLIDIAIDAMDAIEDENYSDKDSEVNIGVYIKANGKDTGRCIHKMLPTGPLNDSAVSYAKAFQFMATPKKKNPKLWILFSTGK